MRFKVRAPQDFWGGIALIVIALIAIWASRDLAGMRGFAFGPGTAPRLFAGLLAFCGAMVALMGLLQDGPKIGAYAIRGPIFIVAAILTFALTIRPLGLVFAAFVTFMIAISGSKEMRPIESVIAAAAMTLFCVGLFAYLLGLPFQLWPPFLYR